MNYESPISGDAQMAPSNVIRLPGHVDAVKSPIPMVASMASATRMPSGYFSGPDGVYFLEQDETGDETSVWICSPITVIGLCRRSCGKGWSRVVDIVDPDGRTHRQLIDEALFNGSSAVLLRPLLDCGLRVAKGAEARIRVADLLGAWRPQETFVRVSRTGWVDDDFDTFALADGTIIGHKKSILERDTGTIGKAARASGSHKDWQETVAAPCVGNPLMMLALSQAFAGPLLAPLGLDGGGFHFRGASSRGKTTLLSVAASVWGAPGYVQSWRSTDNAMENSASFCNSGLLALDELHQVSPQVAGEIIYMLANGRGKQRMTSGGKSKSTDTWHVATLSSGEISPEDHMASGGKKIHAGQEIRLIDIKADGRMFGAFDNLHGEAEAMRFVDKLRQAVASHHGHAGRMFVERLIGKSYPSDSLKRIIKAFVDRAIKTYDLEPDGQVLRVLKRFAVAALAGELATNLGVTGWKKGEAVQGILAVVGIWSNGREVARASQIASARERTRTYLMGHLDRFVASGSTEDLDGWKDDAWFYISSETWSRIHGFEDAQQAARLHKAANLLKTDKGETLQFRMGRNTSGRPKVYAVSIRVLDV